MRTALSPRRREERKENAKQIWLRLGCSVKPGLTVAAAPCEIRHGSSLGELILLRLGKPEACQDPRRVNEECNAGRGISQVHRRRSPRHEIRQMSCKERR